MNSNTVPNLKKASLSILMFMVVPAIAFQVWLFQFIPNYYLQHIFIYFLAIFLILSYCFDLLDFKVFWTKYKKIFFLIPALLFLQILAFYKSAYLYEDAGSDFFISIFKHSLKLIVQIPFIIAILLFCDTILKLVKFIKPLLVGFIFVLALLFAVSTLQLSYSFLVNTPLEFLALKVRPLLLFISNIEAKWPVSIYDFYKYGSYSVSGFRVNGFYEESSALASNAGIFFVPIAYGLKRTFAESRLARLGCALSVGLLLISTSLTGMVLFITYCLFNMSAIMKKIRDKRTWVPLLCVAFFIVVITAKHLWPIARAYVEKPRPRVIITAASLELALENPVLGVGRGWFSPYILDKELYKKHQDNDFEMRSWAKTGEVPRLSCLFGIFAQYGFLFPALVALFFLKSIPSIRLLCENVEDAGNTFFYHTLALWIPMSLVVLFFNFDIRNSMFMVPFLSAVAYIVNINYKAELNR